MAWRLSCLKGIKEVIVFVFNFSIARFFLFLCFLILVLLPVSPGFSAGNVSITRTFSAPSGDSYIQQDSATPIPVSSTTMIVTSWKQGQTSRNRRSLAMFDVSIIPTGSSVSSSTLNLYLSTAPVGTRTHDVHRITSSWAEGTVTWTLMPSFNGTLTGSASTGTANGVTVSWTVSSDVSEYIGGIATNYGWLVKDAAEDNSAQRAGTYDTRENATSGTWPNLIINFTAPWDSYSDSGRTIIGDSFSSEGSYVYMKGTGFYATSYRVGYYDGTSSGGGNLVTTETVAVDGSGVLNSQYLLNTDPNAVPGTWHTLVQPVGMGYTSLPSTYNAAVAAPDTYGLVANDSFSVQSSAIPEFPGAIPAVSVAVLAFAIYLWMKKVQGSKVAGKN